MKEWILENKYMATVIGIICGLTLLLGGLIYKSGSNKTALTKKLKGLNQKIEGLQQTYGNPTVSTREKLEKRVKRNQEDAEAIYQNLAKDAVLVTYSGSKSDNVVNLNLRDKDSGDFGVEKGKYLKQCKEILERGNVVSEDGFYGFSKYASSEIKNNPKAINLCLYQMEAFKSIFRSLSEVGDCKLLKIFREPLKEESESKSSDSEGSDLSRGLRFDMVLNMKESQFLTFIGKLANSSRYLIKINQIRIESSVPKAVAAPTFEEKSDGDGDLDDFGDLDTGFSLDGEDIIELTDPGEPDEKDPEKTPLGPEIVKPIYDNSELTIYLSMELVLLRKVESLEQKPVGTVKK